MANCVGCGRPARGSRRFPVADTPGARCPKCFFRRLARRHAGGSQHWGALRDLFLRQAGRCAYTRDELVLGGTATLDHRQPKSRGGRGLANLQWVAARVNDAKRDMTHAEFVSLCLRVVACSGQPPANSR